jgi:lanthanide-dependent methanol dehydrogenase
VRLAAVTARWKAGLPAALRVACGLLILYLPVPAPAQAVDRSANGFSALGEITAANAPQLRLALRFRTGAPGSHTHPPLGDGQELLVLTPFPHTLYALDFTQPGAPVKWSYTPAANRLALGLTCCGMPSGGMAMDGDRIYLDTLDDHVIAVDRASGAVMWNVAVAAPESGAILTTAPLVLPDKIIVGTSGDDAGSRGALFALDRDSGAVRWQKSSTGPDHDVGIGPNFHPFYRGDRDAELGTRTWPPGAWQQGGGGLAAPLAFDSATNTIFQSTGPPAPWNADQRAGDNRWTSGIFARDAETGDARWFDPINPHDLYALGASGGLIATEQANARRIIHPDANGYVYLLDVSSGEILSAQPYLPITATSGIDPHTGELRRNARYRPRPHSVTRNICPAWPAGSNALPAFSPATHLLYLPVAQLCMDMEAVPTSYIPGTLFTGGSVRMKPAAGLSPGAMIAWNVAEGRAAWSIPEQLPLRGGALVTQGGVVFYGTLDGTFKAVDAQTGRALWQYPTSSGIVSRPASFQGADGHQYVAIISGSGGLTAPRSSQELDARDATAGHGLASALGTMPTPQDSSGTLYLFRLP